MKYKIIHLLSALLATGFVTKALANPASALVKPPVKTVQLSLPSNNGVLVSVTVPLKTKSLRHGAGHRGTQDSAANQHEDERIAAEIERQF